ncbi:MAG: zinc ribbon domain-containing protein [Oscillospiraceae bacterium]|nr:zinc ribbon domain-containing protein [Oscillospiraceae bacterium]
MASSNKTRKYIESLTDEEIMDQLADMFEWMNTYKGLLIEEMRKRRGVTPQSQWSYQPSPVQSYYSSDDEDDEDDSYEEDDGVLEIDSDDEDGIEIDFQVAQSVHQKVAGMSEYETKENLEKLRHISKSGLTPEEIALLHYEIEQCELHLYELEGRFDEKELCPNCGNEVEPGAKFCRECGYHL